MGPSFSEDSNRKLELYNKFMFVKTLVGTRQWGMQTSIKQQKWLVPIDCDAEVQMRNKMSFVPNECCEDA